MDLHQSICQLLREIGPGYAAQSPYDTAWIARLSGLGEPSGGEALEWLREHQLPDGGWGAAQPRYHHDRLICTLAAMTALGKYGQEQDRTRWQRAQLALEIDTKGLLADPSGATAGFEMIIPTLMAEAQELGIVQPTSNGVLADLSRYRTAKLARLAGSMVNRFLSTAFSAEMAGPDGVHLLDVENLQEENGSIAYCPSATSYFALHVRREDPKALQYLRSAIKQGGAPPMTPFDLYEPAWTLWNLSLTGPLDDEIMALCRPHLDFLEKGWRPGHGIGFARGHSSMDGDDTAVAFEVLNHFGRPVDLETVLSYEGEDCFRCYSFEVNPSISTNVHMLGALRQAGLGIEHPSVQKIIGFLRRAQTIRLFWFDKWHTSPYYTTAHAIIHLRGLADKLLEDAVYWILQTQNADGSWGYYMPTAEETAYCLQALVIWKRHGQPVPMEAVKRGAAWLEQHADPPYPPLWIAKCLYLPVLLVRSAILSALTLAEQG
jgi:halimadienyl-diphosphate synthase